MSFFKYAYCLSLIVGLLLPGVSLAKDTNVDYNQETGECWSVDGSSTNYWGNLFYCSRDYDWSQDANNAQDTCGNTQQNCLMSDSFNDNVFCVNNSLNDPCRFCFGKDSGTNDITTNGWQTDSNSNGRVISSVGYKTFRTETKRISGANISTCAITDATEGTATEYACDSGYYKLSGSGESLQCAQCPQRYVTNCGERGNTSELQCMNGFVTNSDKLLCGCPGGKLYTGSACTNCPSNATCNPTQGHLDQSFTCNTGYTKKNGKCEKDAANVVKCVAGKYLVNGECKDCDKGYYQDKDDFTGTACMRCPASDDLSSDSGKSVYGTTETTGATSINDCYLEGGSSMKYKDSSGGIYYFETSCEYGGL